MLPCWYFGSYGFICRLSFLFEVRLLCLSLYTEVLLHEDSEWSRGREIGTIPTYSSLVRAQTFLSFPYVSIKTPLVVTSNDIG